MKTNWLWDSKTNEEKAKEILKDEKHPQFDYFAEKLLSRIVDPKEVFNIIDKKVFCRKWPYIKKRIKKDQWLKDRVVFWQTIYENVYESLKEKGFSVRKYREEKISPEIKQIAQQIKELRQKQGYTQEDVAKKMGVIQQYISKIETGHENVSIDTLRRIANIFDKQLNVELR